MHIFNAFPNPAKNLLKFHYNNARLAQFYTHYGCFWPTFQQIESIIDTDNWEFSLDLSTLLKGFYIYSVETKTTIKAGKFQKND